MRNSHLSVSDALARYRIDQCFASAFTSERRGVGYPRLFHGREVGMTCWGFERKVPQLKKRRRVTSLTFFVIRSELGWEDPLNLSILFSGGKETNKDSLSNGEWSGNSSILKSLVHMGLGVVIWRRVVSVWPGYNSLGKGDHRGW